VLEMSEQIELIEAFLGSWGPAAEDLHGAMHRYLAADAHWENVGLVSTTGPEEAVGLLKQFSKKANFAAFDVEILNIAAVGDVVLCERVDHAIRADGTRAEHGVRVAGVFEVAGGRITSWRDYFDTAPFMKPNKS
jgi:limonene-1,2-epoxide hydrolase